MKRKLATLVIGIGCSVAFSPLEAAYTIKNGSVMEVSEAATMSVQEHYSARRRSL